MKVTRKKFGNTRDEREVGLFTLDNPEGIKVSICNYGGIITSVLMPDRRGVYENVVLGYDRLEDYTHEDYLSSYPYLGAMCGRYAGRISGGQFSIDGSSYQLVQNNGPNHIHGGRVGFDRRLWEGEAFGDDQKVGVKLSYHSPDGEENYPGNLKVSLIYSLNRRDELHITCIAITDKPGPVNLTNHSYFNLVGGQSNVLGHELQLESDFYTENDANAIPTGRLSPVEHTPLDFRSPAELGERISDLPEGYDHNFVIRGEPGSLRKAAILSERESGRKLEVYSTQPGLQVYTGYYLPQINGIPGRFSGVALETQHYPDSPNQPGFPDTILRPGDIFHEHSMYRFGRL